MTDRLVQYADAEAAHRFLGAEAATDVTSCSGMLDYYLEAGSDPETSPQEATRIIVLSPDDQWTVYTSYPSDRRDALCVNLSEGIIRANVSFDFDVGYVLSSELTDHGAVVPTAREGIVDRETRESDPDAGIVAVPLRRRVLSQGELDLSEATIQRRKWRPMVESGPSTDDEL